jgi:DNA-binding response OmpR family regulator
MAEILIIDDQIDMRELLRDDLMDEGHRITCIGNADELVTAMDENHFDLILLDLYLNGFEGWSLLEEIKRKTPGIPVIIVSAFTSLRDDPRIRQAEGYVTKSVYSDGVKNKINQLMRGKQKRLS